MAVQITIRSWVILLGSILLIGYILILVSFMTDNSEEDSIRIYKNEIADLKSRYQSVKKMSIEQANKINRNEAEISKMKEEKLSIGKLREELEKERNPKSLSSIHAIR